MFFKPENRVLRALFWVFVVLVPGGFLLLALLGVNVLHRRMRQESEALALSEAKAPAVGETAGETTDAASEPATPELCAVSDRPSQTAPTHAALSQAGLLQAAPARTEACESLVPVSRVAA